MDNQTPQQPATDYKSGGRTISVTAGPPPPATAGASSSSSSTTRSGGNFGTHMTSAGILSPAGPTSSGGNLPYLQSSLSNFAQREETTTRMNRIEAALAHGQAAHKNHEWLKWKNYSLVC